MGEKLGDGRPSWLSLGGKGGKKEIMQHMGLHPLSLNMSWDVA